MCVYVTLVIGHLFSCRRCCCCWIHCWDVIVVRGLCLEQTEIDFRI